jgi:transposase-like protein
MGLTSEQAKAMNAQPRITPEERDRLIHLLAEGKKPAELALQFGKAVGTIYNFQTRWKAEVDDLRPSRTCSLMTLRAPGSRLGWMTIGPCVLLS